LIDTYDKIKYELMTCGIVKWCDSIKFKFCDWLRHHHILIEKYHAIGYDFYTNHYCHIGNNENA